MSALGLRMGLQMGLSLKRRNNKCMYCGIGVLDHNQDNCPLLRKRFLEEFLVAIDCPDCQTAFSILANQDDHLECKICHVLYSRAWKPNIKQEELILLQNKRELSEEDMGYFQAYKLPGTGNGDFKFIEAIADQQAKIDAVDNA